MISVICLHFTGIQKKAEAVRGYKMFNLMDLQAELTEQWFHGRQKFGPF